MESAESVTLMAALIAVAGAALLFAAGEVVKLVVAEKERQQSAIDRVLESLADVVRDNVAPHGSRRPDAIDLELSVASIRLVSCLPRRDWIFVSWLMALAGELPHAADLDARTVISANATAGILVWLVDRKRGRAMAHDDLVKMGVELSLDGNAIK